jgi:hypothetical protein
MTCSARSFSSASSSSARRAGDRALLRGSALDGHKRLRRRAGDLEVLEVEEVHVRARVHGAQAAVDRERVAGKVGAPALARHHLVGVAGADVLLHAVHGARVAVGAHVRLELRRITLARRDARDRRGQALAHVGDRGHRAGVARLDVALGEHVREHRDGVGEVVEGEQHIRDHQREVGDAEVVGVRLANGRLGRAHQVVAEQAHGAPRERRQALHRRQPVLLELLRDGLVGIVGIARVHADHRARLHAEERPAPEALPLLGRLQQERRSLAAQLEVGRDRGLRVGDEGVAQRHERVLAGQLAHLVERRAHGEPGAVSGDGH